MQTGYRLAEAARLVPTKPLTLRRWIHSGKLRGVKMVGQWRVYPSDLEAFIRERENRPPSSTTEAAA